MEQALRAPSGSSDGIAPSKDHANTDASIIQHCHSIAFFGVPHYSSTPLSDGACAESIAHELRLPIPYGPKLRRQLRNTENLDPMAHFSRQFAPLTLHVFRIWSFYETREMPPRVKIKSDETLQMTETTLLSQIEDKRSATLADKNYYVGCEKVFPVRATHAGLPTFGNGEDYFHLRQYVESLNEVMEIADFEDRGCNILAKTIHVECHQFCKAQPNALHGAVKVFSASPNPTLSQVFQRGPEHFVELRRVRALAALTEASKSLTRRGVSMRKSLIASNSLKPNSSRHLAWSLETETQAPNAKQKTYLKPQVRKTCCPPNRMTRESWGPKQRALKVCLTSIRSLIITLDV
ncbi:uncharacterized protein Z518_10459 [Rhinocladiella mackenziei CBS 650.93]|uniref:Uncharacterized protein n=1 Tax=Rhinocladiella mackenziei CBS 650.93 TaxID=1442369 RepID=A0A0D2IUB1_9EURO|nr:uncharacterized protein Z518_10459 [Rhinocladiella mackenziei CBS 650.93]KIX00320.1 hypothetical protein Z518_10459 [Rhinocladiella mackenziei CBS 650.93]